jgi:hypothetical protein
MPAIDMVEHLVGMQAQIPTNPYLGLWSRIAGFEPAELEGLLLDRRAVRMVVMRGTIHLLSTDDALALRPVMQPVLDDELFRNKTWSVGLEGVDIGPVLELGRRMVEEKPRPLSELRAAIAERWPEYDATTLAYTCRNQLPTFQVPPRGLWHRSGQVALTTIDTWSGRPLGTETAPDAVILRYLAAFGPASTSDVAAWSRLKGMREPMERLRPRLRLFRDERGRELFDLPDAPIADPEVPAPVRLLPDYDNVVLSHDDRSRMIPPAIRANARLLVGGAGFLVDGFAAGFWTTQGKRGARTMTLEPMTPLTADQRGDVEAEALEMLRFLEDGRDVSSDEVSWKVEDGAPR